MSMEIYFIQINNLLKKIMRDFCSKNEMWRAKKIYFKLFLKFELFSCIQLKKKYILAYIAQEKFSKLNYIHQKLF